MIHGISGNGPNKILSDPRITAIHFNLRELCSEGEFLLERLWAEKVSKCETQEEGSYSSPG